LWDRPYIPSSLVDPGATLFDFERDIMGFSRSTTANHGRRFLRYISLYNGAEYIRGLTLYHGPSGIVGLEAHFTRTSQLSGNRDGCALYFPLYPEEKIAYTWLRIINFPSLPFFRPALIVSSQQICYRLLLISSFRSKQLLDGLTHLGHIFCQTLSETTLSGFS
jgi:hypothetical protein